MSGQEENADRLVVTGQARNNNLIAQGTQSLPPSSDDVVEPKQPKPSAAAELGKGKVALIMCALCVSPEGIVDRVELTHRRR